MKREAPAFSMATQDVTGNIIIRVDEGKFMDTHYSYNKLNPTPRGIVEYSITTSQLVVNGIVRDQIELENKFPELAEDFKLNVTNPVLEELISMLQHDTPDVSDTPKIILA